MLPAPRTPSSIRRDVTRAFLIAALVQATATACDSPTDPKDKRQLLVPDASLTVGVSNLSASVISWSEIDVSWSTSPSVNGYQLFRSTSGPATGYSMITTTGARVGTYADIGLNGSTQYCYRVSSFKTAGKNTTYSALSAATCATTLPTPVAAPSEVNATPQPVYAIQVTWKDNSTNEAGFHVERAPTTNGPWAQGVDVPANATSASLGAAPEQQTCFRVIAYMSGGSSLPSAPDCTARPAGPTGLSATALDAASITLNWTDNSAVEDGYRVYRVGNVCCFVEIATLPPNTVTYRDVGVSPDISYTYGVQALKDGGYSAGSNEATAVIPTTIPAAPTGIWATNTNIDYGWIYFDIGWSDNSSNEAGFRVEYSSDGVSDWRYYDATAANVASLHYEYMSDYPQDGCFRVIAFNALGDSNPSDFSCASSNVGYAVGGGNTINSPTSPVTRRAPSKDPGLRKRAPQTRATGRIPTSR